MCYFCVNAFKLVSFSQYIELAAWFFLESFFKNGIYTHCTRNTLIICWALHAWNEFNASFYLFIVLTLSKCFYWIWWVAKEWWWSENDESKFKWWPIFSDRITKNWLQYKTVWFIFIWCQLFFWRNFSNTHWCRQMVCNIGFWITLLSKVISTKKDT